MHAPLNVYGTLLDFDIPDMQRTAWRVPFANNHEFRLFTING